MKAIILMIFVEEKTVAAQNHMINGINHFIKIDVRGSPSRPAPIAGSPPHPPSQTK